MTNNFANTENSKALLKDNYGGKDEPAQDELKEALRRRKMKMIAQGDIPANPVYNSGPIEDKLG